MILAYISIFVAVFVGTLYLGSRVRKQDMQLLRESNQDLRDAMDDNNRKIGDLTSKVELLSKQVVQLQSEKSELTDLVIRALTQYFNDNPTIAQVVKAKLG